MRADLLHDAISALPEDLIEPVDKLRQRKKQFPWKSLGALAACACLVVGLWSLFPSGAKSQDNAGMAPEDGRGDITGNITEESGTSAYLTATVIEVTENHLTVLTGKYLTDIATPVTVLLYELDTVPLLKEGQRIKLYCEVFPEDNQPLVPYRIEIIEE